MVHALRLQPGRADPAADHDGGGCGCGGCGCCGGCGGEGEAS